MSGRSIGYIRVSTIDQNTSRQLDGITLDMVFEDKASGSTENRPGWEKCKAELENGDTLYVHSIDRLARNLEDLQHIARELTERGVSISFMKEHLTYQGKSEPMQMLLFQLMGAFAEFERSIMLERQREGIAKAKLEGKYKGGKPKLSPEQEAEILKLVEQGIPKTRVAARVGVTAATVYAVLARNPKVA